MDQIEESLHRYPCKFEFRHTPLTEFNAYLETYTDNKLSDIKTIFPHGIEKKLGRLVPGLLQTTSKVPISIQMCSQESPHHP